MATIQDIADEAGVAASTVSLVINGRERVKPATRARVEQAIRALDYTPQRAARGLARGRTGNLGFIVRESHFNKAEPFYTRVFLGTEFEARHHEHYILLTSIPDVFDPKQHMPRFVREGNVDGVMVAGRVSMSLFDALAERNLPVVALDFTPARPLTSVVMDNGLGVEQAVAHLVGLGHRQIAFVGGEADHPSISERLGGYRLGLIRAGLTARDSWVVMAADRCTPATGEAAIRRLWSEPERPTAVVAANDAVALGCLRQLRAEGCRVPTDVSLVGFDDVEGATHTDPPLTTVRVFKEDLGAIAVRRLVERIERPISTLEKVIVPVELVVRESTAAPPG